MAQMDDAYKPTNTSLSGKTRIPDVIAPLDVVGHLRHEQLEDAILGCGPHRLPDGRNY